MPKQVIRITNNLYYDLFHFLGHYQKATSPLFSPINVIYRYHRGKFDFKQCAVFQLILSVRQKKKITSLNIFPSVKILIANTLVYHLYINLFAENSFINFHI